MGLGTIKSSIVGRTAIIAAFLSAGISIFIFGIIFAAQQSSYESQLVEDVTNTIQHHEPGRGFLSADEVVHWSKSHSETINAIENVVFHYLVDPRVKGTKPFGKKFTEEPNGSLTGSQNPMSIFHAKGSLYEAYQSQLKPYERLGLINIPLSCQGTKCAELRVAVSLARLDDVLFRLRYSLILATVLIPFATGLIVFFTAQHYLAPIRQLAKRMRQISISKDGEVEKNLERILPAASASQTVEAAYFAESVAILADTLDQANRLRGKLQLSQSTALLARQVAHDIRSPASALNYLIVDDQGIPTEKRLLVKKAVERIQDIANSLLKINTHGYDSDHLVITSENGIAESATTLHVAPILRQIMREKSIAVSENDAVKMTFVIDDTSGHNGYGAFVNGSKTELQSVFSNILNNAIESIEQRGEISVALRVEATKVSIHIKDNGRGIPDSVLPKIFSRGFSHGKINGTGLGLFHARSVIESMSGTISVESTINKGTHILINIPRCAAPPWFVTRLLIAQETNIVICDDDVSVHSLWQKKFDDLKLHGSHNPETQIINFYDLESFQTWFHSQRDVNRAHLYLMDFDFRGEKNTGLEITQLLNLSWQTILVTSYFTELTESQFIDYKQIGLIVKEDAAKVPIVVLQSMTAVDSILVEDNHFVIDAWDRAAKEQGIVLQTFQHPRDLLTNWRGFPQNVPVFIDSQLGHQIKGELLARALHDLGFHNLYITTGHDPKDFADLAFLRGVIGKDPPVYSQHLHY